MSSLEPPSSSTPQPPDLSGDGRIRDGAKTSSETVASDTMLFPLKSTLIKASHLIKISHNAISIPTAPQAPLNADDEFVNAHLRRCPLDVLKAVDTPKTRNLAAITWKAKIKDGQCRPACSLLTTISETIWKFVESHSQDNLARLDLNHYDSPMQFVDHHLSAPTHCTSADVVDRPDIVSVFYPPGNPWYKWNDASSGDASPGIPHYRLEAVIEIEDSSKDAPSRIENYAFEHLRARPDHPCVYCLSIRKQGVVILYADTSGRYVSKENSWDDLEVLAASIYSIYDPPVKHTLRDPSIQWESSDPTDPCIVPVRKIRVSDQEYYHGRMIFGEDPWRRRTTVFECNWPTSGFYVITKDCYQQQIRRYDEWELVRDVHADGFASGVVRFAASKDVEYEDEPIKAGEGDDARIRRGHLMLDRGEALLKAKSVNELLKAVYDVLEVDRVLALERNILHRKLGLYNVLMYPQRGKFAEQRFIEPRPPLIDDILAGKLRDPDEYQANCVLIDFDNGAKMGLGGNKPRELACRTGTPTYISRAVSIGRIWLARHMVFTPMPSLTEEARALYEALHGKARYKQFEDKDDKCHGGIFPKGEVWEVPNEFYHKLEYDAESIWWTTLTACLRVMPRGEEETHLAAQTLHRRWKVLQSHVILDDVIGTVFDERESNFLSCSPSSFLEPFLPRMTDVAKMLVEISKHVWPSYPLMETPPPYPDHLHEAMQRIILNYLVAHRNDDILLDPDNLRSIEGSEPGPLHQEKVNDGAGKRSPNPKKRPQNAALDGERKSKLVMLSKEHSLPAQALTDYPYQFCPRP